MGTSIPEILKEFPRLLGKLGMVRNNLDFMVRFTEIWNGEIVSGLVQIDDI